MILVNYSDSKENYNTYALLADIDTFKEYYPFNFKDWDELSDKVKESYLYLSTKDLDNKYHFLSHKVRNNQKLQFPRLSIRGNKIPLDITNACVLNAIMMFRCMRDDANELKDSNLKSEKIGRTLENVFKDYINVDIVKNNKLTYLERHLGILLSDYIISGLYLCRG